MTPLVVEHRLPAEQRAEIPRFRPDACEAVRREPAADVLRVAAEEEGAARVRDHVDHLGQVNQHDPPVVHQQVVRGQVAVREAVPGQDDERLYQLFPLAGQFGRTWPGFGAAAARRSRRPSRWNSSSSSVSRICAGQGWHLGDVQPGQRAELAAAHWPAMACRPNALRLDMARLTLDSLVRRPSR